MGILLKINGLNEAGESANEFFDRISLNLL